MLISDVTDVLNHLRVKSRNVLFLMLKALSNIMKIISFCFVVLLELAEWVEEGWELLPLF